MKNNKFTTVPEVDKAMTELMQGYTLKRDLCLIGSAGSGKSRLVEQFCKELKQKPTLVNCYRDMSARDLLLKRTTDDNGSTIWEMSPLLKGALNGEIVILDGIHRLESDTLAVLHSLVTHREIDLADGRRLLRHDRFDNIQAVGGNGYINDYPAGRLLRDAKLYEIGAGTSEIRRMLIGRELFDAT